MLRFSKTHLCFVFFLLTSFALHLLCAEAATPVIERAKLATALVELPNEEGFGSAFCITPEGIFVTNQHVVEGIEVGGKVKLVLHAGERNQKIVEATVLRVNEKDDLALLRADSRVPFTALTLGDAAPLTETQPVAAIGFPFGADLALEEGQYPSVTVNIGRITALRKVQGELHELQIDAAINPGNSGGPLINEQGQVIGIVFAGIEDAQAVNFAIAVGRLTTMLKAPAIVFQPPAKLPTDKHQESEFSIKLLPIFNTPAPFSVSLTLSAGKGDQRTVVAQNQGDNQYVARAALLPAGLAQSNLISFTVSVRQGAETVAESKGVIELNVAAPAAGGGTGWLGGAAAPGAGANAGGAGGAPKPEDSNQLVLQGAQAIDDLRVSAFTFPTNEIVSNMLWSADGKKLFVLNKNGMLRRIAVPEFREEKTLNLAQTCSGLALSQLGLVVGLPQIHQVWLIDANTFAVLKRIPAAGVDSVASAPALTTAYATNKEMLTIIDLAEGKAAAQLTPRAASRLTAGPLKKSPDATPLFNFRLPAVTPDGKYFFCVGDESYDDVFGSLHRFRINQNTLIYEEVGPTIGKNPQRIEVSDDSSYVSMPSGGGNTDRGYTTHVYAAGDLAKPVVSLESGAYPRALGFDRIGGKIYAQDFGNQLMVFTPTGIKEKSYKLANGQGAETNQFLASRLGHRVLVSTESQLLWVELPGAGDSRRPVVATAAPLAPTVGGGFGTTPRTPNPVFGGDPTIPRTTNPVFGGDLTIPNADRFKARNPVAGRRVIVPSAQENKNIVWRYTTEKPADGWEKMAFNTANWKEGVGGFGTPETPGSIVGTPWNTADIWLRRPFSFQISFNPADVRLFANHDDDMEVFINGVLATTVTGFGLKYEDLPISTQARAALKPGENVLAIHCHQTTGGQYIDAGIITVDPASRLNFDLTVEGSEFLHIQGDSVWMEHRNGEQPVRNLWVNKRGWSVQWDGKISGKYSGFNPPLPDSGTVTLRLESVRAGNPVSIIQQPTAANKYEAIVLLDDDAQPGKSLYNFTLSWTAAP